MFPSRCAPKRPACRTDRRFVNGAALCSLHAARSAPLAPAKPVAGPLKASFRNHTQRFAAAQHAISGSTAAPVAALGVTPVAGPPLLVNVGSPSLQPLRQASWHIGRDAEAPCEKGSPCASRPTALPPAAPPSRVRGTCGGIFKRWAGKLAHCMGCWNPTHPQPFP